jgi:hypothetical protein
MVTMTSIWTRPSLSVDWHIIHLTSYLGNLLDSRQINRSLELVNDGLTLQMNLIFKNQQDCDDFLSTADVQARLADVTSYNQQNNISETTTFLTH